MLVMIDPLSEWLHGGKMFRQERHTVTVQEIQDLINAEVWEQLACSESMDSNKKLEMNNRGWFRVMNKGAVMTTTQDLAVAVECYNAAA
jgi:hypothetical protein